MTYSNPTTRRQGYFTQIYVVDMILADLLMNSLADCPISRLESSIVDVSE